MQIVVAFAGHTTETGRWVSEGVARVETRYRPRWRQTPVTHVATGASTGLVAWVSSEDSLWPAWVQQGDETVASVYAPVGYERVVTPEPLATAPLRLMDALRGDPGAMRAIMPPFVCAGLHAEADRLTLHTDAVGVGRLFEVATPWGWVWSNHPEAALAFGDVPARPSEIGWQHSAVADEMFGDVTPYEGVTVVDAATRIDWDGRTRRRTVTRLDMVASWAPSGEHGGEDAIDAAAADLAGVAASVARLFPQRPTVDLTGGRDSRLVAAAFLAAGTDVVLHTHDALPGDLDVARTLVGLLDDAPEHDIEHVAGGTVATPKPWEALTNALAWHAFAEGLRPYSYLHSTAPTHLDIARPPVIGGAGGEVAHGFFYPARWDDLERLPREERLSRFAASILQRYAPILGASAEARDVVRAQILATLRDIDAAGHRGAGVLDVFYIRERIRRWGSTAERTGIISPLLSPAFLEAALALTPQQRKANVLHRELTRRLVPTWADVPYYPAEYATPTSATPTSATPARPRVIRVADAADRDVVHGLLLDESAWGQAFDVARVRGLWDASVEGRTDARQERLLRAAVWRGAFTDHTAALSGAPMLREAVPWNPVPAPAPVGDSATPPGMSTGLAPGRPSSPAAAAPVDGSNTVRAQVRRAARRLARTDTWRHLRTTPVGSGIRNAARFARRRGLPL